MMPNELCANAATRPPMPSIVVIGAGGHARAVVDAIQSSASATIHALIDRDDSRTESFSGLPVQAESCLTMLSDAAVDGFSIGLAAVGSPALRRHLFTKCLENNLEPFTVIHAAAIISQHAKIERGAQILAGAIVNPLAFVGENSIVNTGAIVEHDCRVGSDVHLAPRSCLAGGVRVGNQTHIGLGAVIKENIRVGSGAVIGAGAVVIEDIPDGATYVGVPARPIRRRAA